MAEWGAIDPRSSVPPYEQLRVQLARQINDHALAVGVRLPTIRGLAVDLGLAVNTVARAYRELEDAGLIETRGRGGTFVCAGGDRSRERARQAARLYADTVRRLGLDPEESLGIVQAALGHPERPGTTG